MLDCRFALLGLLRFEARYVNREVQRLEREVHEQKIENEALYFEVSELKSPERIITIAREHGLKVQDAKVKRATALNQ